MSSHVKIMCLLYLNLRKIINQRLSFISQLLYSIGCLHQVFLTKEWIFGAPPMSHGSHNLRTLKSSRDHPHRSTLVRMCHKHKSHPRVIRIPAALLHDDNRRQRRKNLKRVDTTLDDKDKWQRCGWPASRAKKNRIQTKKKIQINTKPLLKANQIHAYMFFVCVVFF